MKVLEQTSYIIMSKDRKIIATGNVRDRTLTKVSDVTHAKRILTYKTPGSCISGFSHGNGFYNQDLLKEGFRNYKDDLSDYLEPVKVKMVLTEIKEEKT